MGHQSDPAFTVLHAVRLRGRAALEAITQSTGTSPDAVQAVLDGASADGLVTYREGRAAGWSLTPEGRERHAALLAADRAAASADDAVRAGYDEFLAVNHQLIVTCTRWQMRDERTLNDHSDAAYDAAVIGELHAIDDTVQPACGRLGAALDRFASYGPRLTDALGHLDGGDQRWFTSPALDSYHTVWFELHEDLLQSLGIERGEGR